MQLYRLGEGARKAVKGWGLELLCKDPRWRSDSLTVIETPKVTTHSALPCFLHQLRQDVHLHGYCI